MKAEKVYSMRFCDVYRCLVNKAARKDRTEDEVRQVICWLTGYDDTGLQKQLDAGIDYRKFFDLAPRINEKTSEITGKICGINVESIEDPLAGQTRGQSGQRPAYI